MNPPVATFPPLPQRVRGDRERVREARACHESSDWRAWPDADQAEHAFGLNNDPQEAAS